MKPVRKRVLFAFFLGTLLAAVSYALELVLARAGIAAADTVLDNLLIGFLGGALAFALATIQTKEESQRLSAEAARLEATWEERRRLAREIHDTLAQDLAGIIIQLEAAEGALHEGPREARELLNRARSLARQSLAEARRSVWELRPQTLEGADLPGAFAHLIRGLTLGKTIKTEFSMLGTRRPLPAELEVCLLRIGQEALTNTVKHAQASKVRIQLGYGPQEIGLLVEDDGHGFDAQSENARSGFGLISMRERAASAQGRLTIESQPGRGTQVSATIPARQATATGAAK
jgi:signal transduction histidine kinase